MVGTAVHGYWCNTRAFPTNCRSCNSAIYVFMCDCGSRVLFDQLGPPWPVHDCGTSWTRNLVRTPHSDGSISVQLKDGITVIRPAEGFAVEPSFLATVKKKASKDYNPPIKRVDPPPSGDKDIIGVLREIDRNVDPLTAFSLPDTLMTRAFLGERWKQAIGRMTVHSDDGPGDQRESYTTWIPARLIRDSRIERGISAILSLVSVQLPNGNFTWFCDDFEPLT